MTSLRNEALDKCHDTSHRPRFFLGTTPPPDKNMPDKFSSSACRSLRRSDTMTYNSREQDTYYSMFGIVDSESDTPSPCSPFFPGDWDFLTTGPYSITSGPRSPSYRSDLSTIDPETSDTDSFSESDSEAQYITIPYDSPWYKPPCNTSDDSISSSPLPTSDSDVPSTIPSESSAKFDVDDRNNQLDVFCEELRRLFKPEFSLELDERCFDGLDGAVLTSPARAFEETCWDAVLSSSPSSLGWLVKPIPDVPVDFEEDGNVIFERWVQEGSRIMPHGYRPEERRQSDPSPLPQLRGKMSRDLYHFSRSLYAELH